MAEAERVERGVGRLLRAGFVIVVSLGVIGAWLGTSGWYSLKPGEAAVVLRLGAYARTVEHEGLQFKLPYPFETYRIVRSGELRREKFGFEDSDRSALDEKAASGENAIQTADNNIVNLSYVVQYYVGDAFSYVYGMAAPRSTLRDAAQAAMREVVGSRGIDDVLQGDRGGIEVEARDNLQRMLDSYFDSPEHSAFRVKQVSLQDVKAPVPVQDAFDDVVAATQDQRRALSEATGDAREITERASASARELREAALAYKQAKVLEAQGEADRFEALLAEYAQAPTVTRERLYIETMEAILPDIDKMIVEPGAVDLMPLLSFEGGRRAGSRARAEAVAREAAQNAAPTEGAGAATEGQP